MNISRTRLWLLLVAVGVLAYVLGRNETIRQYRRCVAQAIPQSIQANCAEWMRR